MSRPIRYIPGMAKTPAERGPIGQWLVESRLARGWKTAEVARRELVRLGGIRIAPSQYAEYEAGTRIPKAETLEKFQSFYGSAPTTDTGELAGLVGALSALVEEMRADRREREAFEVRLRAVEAELRLRELPAAAESPERSAPRGSKR